MSHLDPLMTRPESYMWLRVESGEHQGKLLSLEQPNTLLGRPDPKEGLEPDIDLKPYDETRQVSSISRRHAVIAKKPNGFWITDLGSANGTFINDNRLQAGEPARLSYGDRLRLGRIRFTAIDASYI